MIAQKTDPSLIDLDSQQHGHGSRESTIGTIGISFAQFLQVDAEARTFPKLNPGWLRLLGPTPLAQELSRLETTISCHVELVPDRFAR